MTNLLIPADLAATLQIPDLTVTTGEPGGIWCSVSWGVLRGSRRHVVRLPYDRGAATRLRRLAVLDRVYWVPLPYYLFVEVSLWLRPDGLTRWAAVPNLFVVVLVVLGARWKVNPTPSRTARGDLYLPDLPPAVAFRWLEANPGVVAVGRRPTYRRWPPAVYAVGSAVCAAGVAVMVRWIFSGDDIPADALFGVGGLIIVALAFAYLALPTGHTRLNGNGLVP